MKSSVVRNLGSYIEDKLSTNSHIKNICNASYAKMLIDLVRSGQTGKHLAFGQDAKYIPVRPSHSVNKYVVFSERRSSV